MKSPRRSRFDGQLALAALLTFAAFDACAFSSGSTGTDGALNPSTSIEIALPPSGVLNYTAINIPSGVTVTFKRNALNTPVHLLVSTNATIAGTINVKGQDGTDVGTAGGGAQADDGKAGSGGPGGFDGGVGGRALSFPDSTRWSGGAGFGPGGGWGGAPVADRNTGNCVSSRYSQIAPDGLGASYSTGGGNPAAYSFCAGWSGTALPYGSPAIQPMIGGSGGGGGAGSASFSGSGGGGGGGAILIAVTGTLTVSGSIIADGGNGGGVDGAGSPGRGGGGAGGGIRLVATTLAGTGNLSASAGCNKSQGCYPYTGQASPGRIRLEGDSVTFSGPSTPTATKDVPGPVAFANAPAIRIATVAGQAVPSNPTGVRDLSFATPPANPVTVGFATTSIPPGNVIKLRVVPAYGDPIEALSPAITGTTANGIASVSINLPTGASTMQAVASFTVAVAMGESLSRFAQNERVERIEIASSLGAESEAYLVTASGKRYRVPVSLLQMMGALG